VGHNYDIGRGTNLKTKTSQEKTPKRKLAMKPKTKTKKSHPVKFCPKCGSTQVFWAQGLPQLWSLWQCSNCGYRGPVILEDGEMARKLLEKWKKQKRPKTL
jgi:transcription factor S